MMRTCYQVVLLRRQVRKPALSWDPCPRPCFIRVCVIAMHSRRMFQCIHSVIYIYIFKPQACIYMVCNFYLNHASI